MMLYLRYFASCLLLALYIQCAISFTEKANTFARSQYKRVGDVDKLSSHTVVFEVKQKHGIESLSAELMKVADPRSPSYGKHWTKDEINAFTHNPEAVSELMAWFSTKSIKVGQNINNEFIHATALIEVWESLLLTEFAAFVDPEKSNGNSNSNIANTDGGVLVRSEGSYTIPAELTSIVQTVYNTVHFTPRNMVGGSSTKKEVIGPSPAGKISLVNGYVTPKLLNDYYGIASNLGSAKSTQALYEALNVRTNMHCSTSTRVLG